MNAPAVQSPKIDNAFATQCLVSMIERTTKLLTIAARGKGWGDIYTRQDVSAIQECAKQFLTAVGQSPSTYRATSPQNAPHSVLKLGELQSVASDLLTECALAHAAPERFKMFENEDKIWQVHDLAVEFVASVER